MGKPGGFFKKLKAKQKREASHRRRGTKGASPEERRRKHNERVEYFAAKREAEDLAAVSSSSESEASTDSEQQLNQRDRKLRKLRAMLGVRDEPSRRNAKANGKAASGRGKRRRGSEDLDRSSADEESDDEEDEALSAEERDMSIEDSGDESDGEREALQRRQQQRIQRKQRALAAKHADLFGDVSLDVEKASAASGDDQDEEGEADDWETFLGAADDDEDDDSDVEEVPESEDSDRLRDEDLLVDNISDDDSDEEAGETNPFFDLLEEGDDDAEEEEDFIDPNEFEDEEDEEDEELDEDDGAEDDFVDEEDGVFDDDDDDDSDAGDGARDTYKAHDAESRALLPQFRLGTTSLATLQSSGVVATADDPWYLKYHVDAVKEIDRTPLEQVPIAPQALETLKHANAARQERARRREQEEGTAVTKKDVMFVTPEEYDAVHPDNVNVAASATARTYLKKHPPFASAVAVGAGATTSSSTGTSSIAAQKALRPPYVHEALWQRWVHYRLGSEEETPYFSNTAGVVMTPEERGFFDLLQGYADVMDCTRCWQNAESRREIFVLHLLNHWFKARAVVLAHDKMLAAHKERRRRRRMRQQEAQKSKSKKQQQQQAENGSKKKARRVEFVDEPPLEEDNDGEDDDDDDLELRDRGFGKTRLFVMLPMRNQAYEYVNTLVRLLGANPADCPKLAMFEQDFTEVEEAMDPTFKRRPKEYQRQFAGNIDDSFCVGLRLEPDRVHVYAHPLNSDIIICSPLGLRRRLERNGDILVSLSSIEVCIVDEAHVLLEQNWQQVTAVMELLNKRPTETTHGLSDLRRVYAWALEGKSGRHRQTIVSSDLSNATILSTFRSAINSFGKMTVQHRTEEGVLGKVQVPVRQHFIRFDPKGLDSLDDDRFTFFTTNVYPTKINPLVERDVRTIIVVPSYFDFVRLRNHMYREYRESFTAISEYTSIKQQRRALGQFTDLERPVLLITERFYFFKRYFVKMAEVLVFYSPPLFPSFYAALVNRLVATSPNAFVMTVFSQYDLHELNRLVGTNRMRHMLERESSIFSFVTS